MTVYIRNGSDVRAAPGPADLATAGQGDTIVFVKPDKMAAAWCAPLWFALMRGAWVEFQ